MLIDSFDIKSLIRPVIDFPKPGVIFRDITPLLQSPKAGSQRLEDMGIPTFCLTQFALSDK